MLIDVTRLMRRMLSTALSGVDRVELAYARRYIVEGDAEACVRFRSHFAVIARPATLRFLNHVEAVWTDSGRGRSDDALLRFEAAIGATPNGGDLAAANPLAAGAQFSGYRFLASAATAALRQTARLPRKRARARVYVNVAHSGLERPRTFRGLIERNCLKPAIFVHDLIPITHAEYARPGHDKLHQERLRTASISAARLIVNSRTTGAELDRWARSIGLSAPPTTVAPLGIEESFYRPGEPLAARRPYFVCVGTIEARKNHLLLLNIWRALAERMGESTPLLALVGRRGWESEQVHDMIERCRPLANHVFELSNLGDDYLSRLIRGSRALLFPSFVEGYGLPLLEAVALGAPAIASDIAAFREIAGGAAEMIDPLDGIGWRAAIEAYADPNSPRRLRQIETLARIAPPPRWSGHFAIVDPVLADLAREIR
jgi:glycosyltransferase involved in cell wall biosynthesis